MRAELREQVEVVISLRQASLRIRILRFAPAGSGHGFHLREYTCCSIRQKLAPYCTAARVVWRQRRWWQPSCHTVARRSPGGSGLLIAAAPKTPATAPEPARLQDSQPRLRLSNADDAARWLAKCAGSTGTGL